MRSDRPISLDDGLLKMPAVFLEFHNATATLGSLCAARSPGSPLPQAVGRHPEMGGSLIERLAGARHVGEHLAFELLGAGGLGLWHGIGFLFGFAALPVHQTGITSPSVDRLIFRHLAFKHLEAEAQASADSHKLSDALCAVKKAARFKAPD